MPRARPTSVGLVRDTALSSGHTMNTPPGPIMGGSVPPPTPVSSFQATSRVANSQIALPGGQPTLIFAAMERRVSTAYFNAASSAPYAGRAQAEADQRAAIEEVNKKSELAQTLAQRLEPSQQLGLLSEALAEKVEPSSPEQPGKGKKADLREEAEEVCVRETGSRSYPAAPSQPSRAAARGKDQERSNGPHQGLSMTPRPSREPAVRGGPAASSAMPSTTKGKADMRRKPVCLQAPPAKRRRTIRQSQSRSLVDGSEDFYPSFAWDKKSVHDSVLKTTVMYQPHWGLPPAGNWDRIYFTPDGDIRPGRTAPDNVESLAKKKRNQEQLEAVAGAEECVPGLADLPETRGQPVTMTTPGLVTNAEPEPRPAADKEAADNKGDGIQGDHDTSAYQNEPSTAEVDHHQQQQQVPPRSPARVRTRKSPRKGKPLPCEQCEMTFSRREHLARHVRTVHLKQKDAKCRFCGRDFSRRDNSLNHERTCAKNPAKA